MCKKIVISVDIVPYLDDHENAKTMHVRILLVES